MMVWMCRLFAMALALLHSAAFAQQQMEYRVTLMLAPSQAAAAAIISQLAKGGGEAEVARLQGETRWVKLRELRQEYAQELVLLGKGEFTRKPIPHSNGDWEEEQYGVLYLVAKRGPDETRARLQRDMGEDLRGLLPHHWAKLSESEQQELRRRMENLAPHPRAHIESRCGSVLQEPQVDRSSAEEAGREERRLYNVAGCAHDYIEALKVVPGSYLSNAERKTLQLERVSAIDGAWFELKTVRLAQANAIFERAREQVAVLEAALRAKDDAAEADRNAQREVRERREKADIAEFSSCVDIASTLDTDQKEAERHDRLAANGVRSYEASARRLIREVNRRGEAFNARCAREWNFPRETAEKICSHPAYQSFFCDHYK